jgi:hypothetical protein
VGPSPWAAGRSPTVNQSGDRAGANQDTGDGEEQTDRRIESELERDESFADRVGRSESMLMLVPGPTSQTSRECSAAVAASPPTWRRPRPVCVTAKFVCSCRRPRHACRAA